MPTGFVAVGSTPRIVAPVPKIGESHAPSPSTSAEVVSRRAPSLPTLIHY